MDRFITPEPLDNRSFKALLTTAPDGCRATAGRALNSWAFLTLAATTGKPLPMWRQTIARRLDHLAAAGLAPIADARALVDLAQDLGLSDEADLIRLVWVLNRSRCQSFAAASRKWHPLAREAMSRLALEKWSSRLGTRSPKSALTAAKETASEEVERQTRLPNTVRL